MCRRKKKVHYISESEPVQRNFYEEDDSYTYVVIDRVKERQTTTTTNDTQRAMKLKLQVLTVLLKLDMGSDIKILPTSYYKKWPPPKKQRLNQQKYA